MMNCEVCGKSKTLLINIIIIGGFLIYYIFPQTSLKTENLLRNQNALIKLALNRTT